MGHFQTSVTEGDHGNDRIHNIERHFVNMMDCNCSFSNLPTSLLCNVLRDWLDLRAVSRFDSALCIRTQRTALCSLYASPELVLPVYSTLSERKPIVWNWIIKKRIKVAHFTDCGNIESAVANEYLEQFGLFIESVAVHIREDLQLAQYCRNIKSLTFGNIHGRGNCSAIISNNPDLEELRLDRIPDQIQDIALPKLRIFSSLVISEVPELFLPFLKSAGSLLKLELKGGSFPPHLLANCLYSCPHLKSLGLINCNLDDVELDSISVYGASIVNLNLSYNQDITDNGVWTIVSQLKLLKSLCLECCSRLTNLSTQYIAEHCTQTLEVLYLGSYSHSPQKLTQADIDRLRHECTNLHTFHYVLDVKRLIDIVEVAPTFVKSSVFTWSDQSTTGSFMHVQILSLGNVGLNVQTLVTCVRVIKKTCANLHTIIVFDKSSKVALEAVLLAESIHHIAVTDDRTYASYNVLDMPINN